MKLPESGKIVVIDDKINEGIPLVKALIKNGHLTTYFTGQLEDLPDSPLSGIRIVFLDIILGTESQDEKTQMATAKHVVTKILSKSNGPFILVAWTKHEPLIAKLENVLRDDGFQFLIFDMKKEECKRNDKEYDVEKIRKKLQEKMEGNEALQLFISWENLVQRATGKIVNDFSSLNPLDSNWNNKMTTIFWKMAVGFAGKQLKKENPDEIIKNALYSFNGAFLDALNSEIRMSKHAPEIELPFEEAQEKDIELTAEINSKLIFTQPPTDDNLPGNLYEDLDIEKVEVKELFIETGSKKFEEVKGELSNLKHIVLEITPLCDYTQNKWKVNRLLPGVLWPIKFEENIKSAKFIYKSPAIKYKDKLYRLVFDFRYFTSIPFGKLKGKKRILRVKEELLIDMQSSLASQVNRPGIVSVD